MKLAIMMWHLSVLNRLEKTINKRLQAFARLNSLRKGKNGTTIKAYVLLAFLLCCHAPCRGKELFHFPGTRTRGKQGINSGKELEVETKEKQCSLTILPVSLPATFLVKLQPRDDTDYSGLGSCLSISHQGNI